MRTRRGSLRASFVAGLGMAVACGREGTVRLPAPQAAVASPAPGGVGELVPNVPVLHVVLDEPRFAPVKLRLQMKDGPGAAKAFDDARAANPLENDAARACALDYVSGRLHRDAGEDAQAVVAFDRVTESCPLAPEAALYAGGAYARLGRADEAIARAARVAEDSPLAADARLLRAEALSAKGDRAAALPIWRAHLAASPRGVRWVDTCVRAANALLDGVDGPAGDHAREALDLATRVVVEAPKLADAAGAQAARDRAVAVLRATLTNDAGAAAPFDDALSRSDRARRAQAWLDANEPARALAEVTPLLEPLPAGPLNGTSTCQPSIVFAQATAKLHGPAADAYGDAITRCTADDALPSVLFNGAKASLAAKRLDEGVARFAQLERLFPHHRLADDARLRSAIALQQNGSGARAEALLDSLADDYPDGDMRSEALFRLALARMTRADWDGAKGPLDRALAIAEGPSLPVDHRSPSAGRIAYFRARVAAMTGDPADASSRYEALIGRSPLSFYMTQAYARLSASDSARARHALEAALDADAKSAPAALLTRDHPELHAPGFLRWLALLEVGEIDDARREIGRVLTDGTDTEVAWLTAFLYEQAGFADVAESLVSARVGDVLAHYPAGGWKSRWEIAFPRPFGDLVERASAASKVPSTLTWAIMRQESAFVPDARSASDAYGLMQLIVSTARGVARGTGFVVDPESLKRPDVSITLGAKLLGGLRASYPSNRALAIAAYNGGGGSVARWLAARPNEDFDLWVEEIPFEETRNYLKRVLGNEAAYAFLYAPDSLDEVLGLPAKVTR